MSDRLTNQGEFMNKLLLALVSLTIAACTTSPHKAVEIDTAIKNATPVGSGQQLGIKDGNMVVQKKVLMSEELRSLQIEVYTLEDHVYGNRRYGSLGLYGVLKQCRFAAATDGKLKWTEPLDRVSDKEEDFQIGLEKDAIVGVSVEFLKDRIDRFRGYKKVLHQREDGLQEKIDICNLSLAAKVTESN